MYKIIYFVNTLIIIIILAHPLSAESVLAENNNINKSFENNNINLTENNYNDSIENNYNDSIENNYRDSNLIVKSNSRKAFYRTDTADILPRNANSAYNELIKDNELHYNAIVKRTDFWEYIKLRIFNFINELLGKTISNNIYQIIFLMLFLLLIIYFAMKLFDKKFNSLFERTSVKQANYAGFAVNLEETDFDSLISAAISSADFRLGLRLLYLKTLKMLSSTGVIQWHPAKTNYEYVQEIKDTEIRRNFANLSKNFNYSEYGNKPTNREQFDGCMQIYDDFLKLVSSGN